MADYDATESSGPGKLERIANSLAPDVRNTLSDPREEVIVRYTRGSGQFSPDKRYIALNMKMFKLNGEEDGFHEGVWERAFERPEELIVPPRQPEGPMNEPVGPVEHLKPLAYTKARWVFGDGSSIIVSGPASTNLIVLSDGSFVFNVITAQIITGGTGKYEGVHGLVQSLGSTYIPAGVELFGPGDVSFIATTLDTFRVIRGRYYAQLPQQQPGPADPQKKNLADYPYESKFVDVHGSKMHYIEAGKGQPILFIHGNPTWSYLWRNVIPHLKDKGHCIAVDLIGMGKSDKPNIEYTFDNQAKYLEGFIHKLNLKKVTLVIHDWGSGLGFHYAMRHENNVKGIAFMEALLKPYESWDEFPASGNEPPTSQIRQIFSSFRKGNVEGKGEGWKLIVESNAMVEAMAQQASPGKPLPDEVMKHYREPFEEKKSRRVIWYWVHQIPIAGDPPEAADRVGQYSEALKESRIPMLLVYGVPGFILTEEHRKWADDNLQNLKWARIDNGLHFLQEVDPDRLGQELVSWYSNLG